VTRLWKLDVTALRGITRASLAFDGGSVVLGGGNGTGKSAFVDALEFLYTGSVSTLSGVAGLSLRLHGPHVRHDGNEARVSATYCDPDLSITRHLSGVVDVPAALETHLARGGRLSFILRRAQLQQFIHATPANRYRSMTELIGAETLDRTELAFKRAADAIERDVTTLEARRAEIENALRALPQDESTTDELLAQANEALSDLGFEIEMSELADTGQARTVVLERLSARQVDTATEARERAADALSRGIEQGLLREAIRQYLELARARHDVKLGAQALDLLQVLLRGRDYILQINTSRCPLCEQRIEAEDLLRHIAARITDLEAASLFKRKFDEARDALDSSLQATAARTQEALGLLARTGITAPSTPLDALAMLRESVRTEAVAESVDMAERLDRALDRWQSWSEATATTLRDRGQRETEDPDRHRAAEQALAVIEQVRVTHAAIERSRQDHQALIDERRGIERKLRARRRSLKLARDTYGTFNRVKNREIQTVYDELRSDLADYYDFLHPEEGHGVVQLTMDPRKRGSSELQMGFYERALEDPRAFSSEGHLDSLGLCLFLAFANRFNGDWPLLVLDDVVTSVDAAHKQRVADLLFQRFGDRQLFITTHDARWFVDLGRAQRDSGNSSTSNLVIESWSLEAGPQLRLVAS